MAFPTVADSRFAGPDWRREFYGEQEMSAERADRIERANRASPTGWRAKPLALSRERISESPAKTD